MADEIKEDITVPEIKAELDALDANYDPKANKEDLYELLVAAREEAAAVEDGTDVEDADETTAAEEVPDEVIDCTNPYDVVVACQKLQIRSEPDADNDENRRYVVLNGGILTALGEIDGWTVLADGNYAMTELLEKA